MCSRSSSSWTGTMRPGDVVAWTHRREIQLGVLTSADSDRVWLFKLVPPAWQLRRIVKPRGDVTLVVAASELHPVLLRQAETAIRRTHAGL